MSQGLFELSQLRSFLIVAEELNFRRAAVRLNMTQPPLSRQIRLLEERIELKLLERDTKSVRLTPAGKAFRTAAIDLMERAEYAVLSARQAQRGESGTITLGFVPSASIEFVPRIVAALRHTLPEVKFKPLEMMSYEIIESLKWGRIDLGLTRTAGQPMEMDSTQVVSEPFILALPCDHPLANNTAVSLADIDDIDFVGYSGERGGYLQGMLQALFTTLGVTPRIVQQVSQTQTVLSLVNVGLGVALVPKSAEHVKMQNLAFKTLDIPEQYVSTMYLNRIHGRHSILSDRVIEAILDALKPDKTQ